MFVGHALLAFALVALVGERLGRDRAVVIPAAVLAGLFATLPDVDVVYGFVGLFGGTVAPVESFWAAGNRVHRGVTHALPVGLVTGLAVWLLARRGARSQEQRTRLAGLAAPDRLATLAGLGLLAGLVALAFATAGRLDGLVAVLFAAGALALVGVGQHLGLSPRAVAGAALVGLVTHPFGDLVTGVPPHLLYPFDAVLVAERVTLAADPTLHLLGAFGLELATAWLAFVAALRLTDRRVRDHVDRRALRGAVYGPAALVLPAPTLGVSYHFVYSVLAVGAVGAVDTGPLSLTRTRAVRAAGTALATVSVAALAYLVVYALA